MIHDSWTVASPPPDNVGIPIANATVRSLLIRRGVTDDESYRQFVAPSIDDLHDPMLIHGMREACERIEHAVRHRETIAIYGDYDVDGVTSIVMLQTVLRALGADVTFVVPQRLVDGYGLKIEVLERVLADRDVRLVITVDCGITSVEPVRIAIERGIDVIVTDHHLPPGTLPDAAAVLNPRQPGCTYPFKDLAGVGVAFKLCCALIRRAGARIPIESLLRIAAIGTVADVAPLTGENRTITSIGLAGLANARNRGLRTLLKRLGLEGRRLRSTDVGFRIGPRINAAGRLASANTAIDLFDARDDDTAWQICAELDRMNSERQQIEIGVREEAESQIREGDRIHVLAGDGWHRGVLGLVAGRIAQQRHRPVLVMALENGTCIGSGRSIGTIDLHGELSRVGDLFSHFGGHEFACGFSLRRDDLEALRQRLRVRFEQLDAQLFHRNATADATLLLKELDDDFLESHELLQPFGAGNPQPLFLVRETRITSRRSFAENCQELTLDDGSGRATAVAWPGVKDCLDGGAEVLDLLVRVEPDRRSNVRLEVVDARDPFTSSAAPA